MRLSIANPFLAIMATFIALSSCAFSAQSNAEEKSPKESLVLDQDTLKALPPKRTPLQGDMITITKDLLYDKRTLQDKYPYRGKQRRIKWEAIRAKLAELENFEADSSKHLVMQNYRHANGVAPNVKGFSRSRHGRVADSLGVEKYQSSPLYHPSDTLIPRLYGRDGSVAHLHGEKGEFYVISPLEIEGEWLLPKRYATILSDSTLLNHAIIVDREYQHIVTLERTAPAQWSVRSINPATTGVHRPPYSQETPLGTFLLQEKKQRMYYYRDGTTEIGGFAPYASRFTNGAYVHGVATAAPGTGIREYSQSLGTTPRSHMCVRNPSSHAKFIYEWAPTMNSVVIVIGTDKENGFTPAPSSSKGKETKESEAPSKKEPKPLKEVKESRKDTVSSPPPMPSDTLPLTSIDAAKDTTPAPPRPMTDTIPSQPDGEQDKKEPV